MKINKHFILYILLFISIGIFISIAPVHIRGVLTILLAFLGLVLTLIFEIRYKFSKWSYWKQISVCYIFWFPTIAAISGDNKEVLITLLVLLISDIIAWSGEL
jgi:hypothetical protein